MRLTNAEQLGCQRLQQLHCLVRAWRHSRSVPNDGLPIRFAAVAL